MQENSKTQRPRRELTTIEAARDKDNKIADDATYAMYIGGGALEVIHGNYLLMDYECTDYGDDFGNKKSAAPSVDNRPGNEHKFQMVY